MTATVSPATSAIRQRVPRNDTMFRISFVFLILISLVAVLAPVLAPYGPGAVDFANTQGAPSAQHLLGTDQMGRDILTRLMYGAQASLLGPVVILAIASAIGVPLGVFMAWRGGWVDAIASRGTDMFYAFPGLFFALLVIAVFGRGMTAVTVALGFAFFPTITKFTRSLAIAERGKPYIEAYRVQGVSGFVVCFRRLLPNIAPAVLGYIVVLFGDALMSLVGLSFLGFGAQPPSSEWGLMVSEGQISLLQGAWLPTIVPGLAIVLTVVAVNLVGIKIADRFGKGV